MSSEKMHALALKAAKAMEAVGGAPAGFVHVLLHEEQAERKSVYRRIYGILVVCLNIFLPKLLDFKNVSLFPFLVWQ